MAGDWCHDSGVVRSPGRFGPALLSCDFRHSRPRGVRGRHRPSPPAVASPLRAGGRRVGSGSRGSGSRPVPFTEFSQKSRPTQSVSISLAPPLQRSLGSAVFQPVTCLPESNEGSVLRKNRTTGGNQQPPPVLPGGRGSNDPLWAVPLPCHNQPPAARRPLGPEPHQAGETGDTASGAYEAQPSAPPCIQAALIQCRLPPQAEAEPRTRP